MAGGAESHCRQFASRLAARGHRVDVLTTCAVNYVDWANHYPPGTDDLDGVTVHRLPVQRVRDDRLFPPLNTRATGAEGRVPLHLEHQWMRAQGPYVPQLVPWLSGRAPDYDVVVFFTFLYYTTWAGLPVAAALAPTVLHPTAHDEPALHLDIFRILFRHPAALACSTEEEEELLRRQFGVRQPSAVIGVGVDLQHADDGGRMFRAAYGLGERPYLVFVGRVDPHKGSVELLEFFAAYKERAPGPLALAVIGDPVRPLEDHPDVVCTGFVSEAVKESALSGALALVQPSYFESFSMVLTETWAHAKPVLVQGHCDVLVGQCRRSGGGIPYQGYAEFGAAVDLLQEDSGLRQRLGQAGRRYVEEQYAWDAVLDRYEELLESVRRPAGARR